jgi:branched-chain amino acid aminotransferase
MPAPPSPQPRCELIWFDGEFIPWDEARIHVLSHALHYGSSVFEGIRCYKTQAGPAIFRLRDHLERMFYSARVLRMPMGHDQSTLEQACIDAVALNKLRECYIRPLAFRGVGGMGLFPGDSPTHTTITVWSWGAYLGEDGLNDGIDVGVSSYNKVAPNTFPALAKIGGAYVVASLAKMEAKRHGYEEGILLDTEGRVAEGTGENIFAVLEGRLVTPPLGHSILGGITRRTVFDLAKRQNREVVEQTLSREALYLAEELFFTGTAAEITPIRSVDGIPVGSGRPGPVTRAIQQEFFATVKGEVPDVSGWLTPVVAQEALAD